jgi:hypothetical protein
LGMLGLFDSFRAFGSSRPLRRPFCIARFATGAIVLAGCLPRWSIRGGLRRLRVRPVGKPVNGPLLRLD